MNNSHQLVSIIMATYNRAHFIIEALQSIENQSYKNWECLIIDDGSSDNTFETVKPILENDSRFRYLKRPNNFIKGLPGSRNYGLYMTKGDYIIFFDDDDIVHPLCLEISLSAFKNIQNLSFCNFKKEAFLGNFNYDSINSSNESNLEVSNDDLLENVITCTVLWKRECFKENVFNEGLMYAEEWECYQRILSHKPKGALIDKVLYYNRKHDKSNTGEFWKGDDIRVASKKTAIQLVVNNLYKKDLLTPYLFKYLVNYAISFRDFKLVKSILKITKPKIKLKLFYIIKYYLFPFWVFYKKIIKYK